MSTLLVDELYNGVTIDQRIKISRDVSVAHIRPWVYKHGTLLDGDFRISILQGATTLLTKEINFSTINAEFTDSYAHGSLKFDFDSLILFVEEGSIETEYVFRFEMINHTTDTDNFLGLCRRWEAKTYDTYGDGVIDNEAPNDFIEPYGLEIYEYKLGR